MFIWDNQILCAWAGLDSLYLTCRLRVLRPSGTDNRRVVPTHQHQATERCDTTAKKGSTDWTESKQVGPTKPPDHSVHLRIVGQCCELHYISVLFCFFILTTLTLFWFYCLSSICKIFSCVLFWSENPTHPWMPSTLYSPYIITCQQWSTSEFQLT